MKACLRNNLIRVVITATLIIVGAIFASAIYREPAYDGSDNNTHTSNRSEPGSFLEKTENDPVAVFTAVLALFTLVLAAVSIVQISFLTKADKTGRLAALAAKRAANAATLNARAALGAELPIVSLSKISLALDDQGLRRVHGHPPKESVLSVDFKNFGRSPAEVIGICIEWAVEKQLPPDPAYKSVSPYPPGTFIEPTNNVPNGPLKCPIKLKDNEVAEISDEVKFLWVFGFILFEDAIVGKSHKMRFCAKWQAYILRPDGTLHPAGFVYDAQTPPTYTGRD